MVKSAGDKADWEVRAVFWGLSFKIMWSLECCGYEVIHLKISYLIRVRNIDLFHPLMHSLVGSQMCPDHRIKPAILMYWDSAPANWVRSQGLWSHTFLMIQNTCGKPGVALLLLSLRFRGYRIMQLLIQCTLGNWSLS